MSQNAMRQYQVPQFITIEDKVIGPLTIKQAVYIGIAVLIIAFAWINFQPFLFWPITIIVGGMAVMLAFAKINEQPFPTVLKNAVLYIVRPRLYIWQKRATPATELSLEKESLPAPPNQETTATPQKIPKKISESRLSDLAWSLDMKEMWKEQE